MNYAAFDANPFLLNVQNGTLNLATGMLQPFNKKDLLTKICAASYEEKLIDTCEEKQIPNDEASETTTCEEKRTSSLENATQENEAQEK